MSQPAVSDREPTRSERYRSEDDEALVRLAQTDDTRAFDELVHRYQGRAYRLCFRILRHEEEAAEALQDAFLLAFRGIRNFKLEATFSTWLYRITTNASLMKYRRRRDNIVSLEQSHGQNDDAEPLQVPDWANQPLENLLNAETRRIMEHGLQLLPEALRTVFVLRDVEELSNAEVAEILEVSVGAVKSRLHKARLVLRDRLNRYFAGRVNRRERRAPGSSTAAGS